MKTRKLALTGAATTLIASLAGGASPALAAPSCSSGSTLAISKNARVFSVKDGSIRRVYGCSTSTGNRSYLGRAGAPGIDTSVLVLNGRRVAYVRNSSCGAGGCQQSVIVRDLKEQETLLSVPATPGNLAEQVTDIVLSKGGTVGWISQQNPSAPVARYVFRAKQGQAAVPVAFGLNIVPGSLALASLRLYWLQPTAVSALLP